MSLGIGALSTLACLIIFPTNYTFCLTYSYGTLSLSIKMIVQLFIWCYVTLSMVQSSGKHVWVWVNLDNFHLLKLKSKSTWPPSIPSCQHLYLLNNSSTAFIPAANLQKRSILIAFKCLLVVDIKILMNGAIIISAVE